MRLCFLGPQEVDLITFMVNYSPPPPLFKYGLYKLAVVSLGNITGIMILLIMNEEIVG